jgi:hypothetical protein
VHEWGKEGGNKAKTALGWVFLGSGFAGLGLALVVAMPALIDEDEDPLGFCGYSAAVGMGCCISGLLLLGTRHYVEADDRRTQPPGEGDSEKSSRGGQPDRGRPALVFYPVAGPGRLGIACRFQRIPSRAPGERAEE